MMLVMIFIMLPRASVSAKRINEVLDTKPAILNGKAKDGKAGSMGEIAFNHVSFKYPDAADYILEDISFTAKKGEIVAFIGSTGSGKTTLINLIPRFYDVAEGEVLVDGINVKEYELEALYNKIGYVPQKAVLFKGTVASNVAYGENGEPLGTGRLVLGDAGHALVIPRLHGGEVPPPPWQGHDLLLGVFTFSAGGAADD